jgi:hypothetical protein
MLKKSVTFRCDIDDARKVEKMAEGGECWRFVVKEGLMRIEEKQDYGVLLELNLQVLALLRRIAGSADESLIALAREDAKRLQASIEERVIG